MKQINFLVLSLAFIALTSCNPKVEITESASSAATIDGVWSTDCLVNGSDSMLKTFQVQNGALTMATLFYSGTVVCDQSKQSATFTQYGQLTLTGDNAGLADGKNYEWVFSAILVTPNDSDTVDLLNNGNACGSNAWVKDQAQFIFACDFTPAFNLSQVTFNTTHYGVYHIDTAVTPNYLQFGDSCSLPGYEDICPAIQDRPTAYSGTTYFRR